MAWRGATKKHVAVIDVSSASVGGVLMDNEREVLRARREPSAFLFDVNFDAFWRVTKKALVNVVQYLSLVNISPDRVVVVLSSPWFIAETRGVKITKSEPWRVTDKILSELLNHEEQRFLRERHDTKGKSVLTEHLFLRTDLNGYFTRHASGKEASTLDADIYISMCVEKVVNDIRDVIGNTWGDVTVVLHTFPYSALVVMREIVNTNEGFTLVDIRGEMTDLLVMRNHTLEELASFPIGTNLTFRRLASMDKTTIKEASSIVNAYFTKHLEKRESKRVMGVLTMVRDEWCSELKETISNMKPNVSLPQNFFVLSEDALRKHLTSCIADNGFASYTTLGLDPTVRFVNTESLRHFFTFAEGAKRDADISLLIEAFYASRH